MASKVGIRPLHDRVVVRPVAEHERGQKTKPGIFIPETVKKERAEQGTVVAVGPGKIGDDGKLIPMSVKEGDLVLFSKYGPDEFKIDDKDYYILTEAQILGVITE